ncbi:MAG: PorV/PorQ family protein [Gemmatimonadetes bacterium]|nr:PorV/PorQ family protein [Gemmatimonadota bacterium]
MFPFALLLLTAYPPNRLSAQQQPLNSGALFLVFPVGATAVGMGQTAVAADGSGDAAFWNPAGLATIAAGEFSLHTANLAAGRTSAISVYAPRNGIGVLGGAIYLVDYGDLPRTDSNNVTIGRISPRNFELLASFATELGGSFVLGLNYKLIEFRVDCSGDCTGLPNSQGITHAVDIGGQFQVGGAGGVRVGMAVRNIGFKLQVQNRDQADALPARLALGAVYQIRLKPAAGATSGDRFDLRLAADVDSPWGHAGASEMRLGLDLGYRKLVRLRGGYAFVRDGLSGPSVGMGLTSGSIGVDLARTFLAGTDLVVENPTFFSFRVAF